jgi:hypothetical protein
MMLMPSSYYAAAIVILSWMTESITQPAPKRAAAMAFINALCVSPRQYLTLVLTLMHLLQNTPNVWTSFLYTGAPRYAAPLLLFFAERSTDPSLAHSFTIAFSVNLAASALAVAFTLLTRVYLARKNADMDRGKVTARGAPTEEQIAAGFRYNL